MELDSLGLFTWVGVNIFYFNDFWDVLYNWDHSFQFVDFHDIDDFLLEEFEESWVALFSEFRILFEVLLHLDCQHVDQVLGSGILNWDFNNLFSEIGKVQNTFNNWNLKAFISQQCAQVRFVLESDTLGSELLELSVYQTWECTQSGSEFAVLLLNLSDLSCSHQKWLNVSSGNVRVLNLSEGCVQSYNLLFKFVFSLWGSSESFFEVLDFLLKFNNLVFLFVKNSSVIHGSVSFFLVLDWEVNSSLEKSFNFVFEKKQSSVQLLSFISSNDDFLTSWEELVL